MGSRRERRERLTRALVVRAKEGDTEALVALYRLYYDDLLVGIRHRLGPPLRRHLDSVDLVQSVWKDVLEDLKSFEYEGPDAFLRWLNTCLTHKLLDKGKYYRAGKRDVARLRSFKVPGEGGGPSDHPGVDPTPSREAMGREEMRRVVEALQQLPEEHRRVLKFRLVDELTYREIGDKIGRSPESARKLCGRCLVELKRRLGEHA